MSEGADLFKHGEHRRGIKMMSDGASTMAGLAIAGWVANEALSAMGNKWGSKYKSYGVDAFAWEVGGVSFDIMKEVSETLGEVLTSFDGTDEDRRVAMEKAVKMFDNTMIRQMLPLMKNAFAFIESVTGRSYIQPLYELMTKYSAGYPKSKTYVQRNMLEGISHAVMATDPSKSEATRKHAFMKLKELESAYAKAKKPWSRAYLQSMIAKYKYLNDVYMRFQPYELAEDKLKKEWMRWHKEMSQDTLYDELYKSQKQMYSMGRQ
jgi:hypothetical protein